MKKKPNTYRRVKLDVFLNVTLGGFAPPPKEMPHPRYHSTRLVATLAALIEQYQRRRMPWGTMKLVAERFGRSEKSLVVTLSNMRRMSDIRRSQISEREDNDLKLRG